MVCVFIRIVWSEYKWGQATLEQVLLLTVDHLSNNFLFSFMLISSNSEVSCGHRHRTYFDSAAGLSWQTLEYIISVASSGSIAGSSITLLKVEGLVCCSSFHLLSSTWALHRDLKVCVGKGTLGTDFTSGLETQLFLIYKCLVVRKSVSLPKLHIKVFALCLMRARVYVCHCISETEISLGTGRQRPEHNTP